MFLHSPVSTEPCSGEVTIVQVSIPIQAYNSNTGNDNNFIIGYDNVNKVITAPINIGTAVVLLLIDISTIHTDV